MTFLHIAIPLVILLLGVGAYAMVKVLRYTPSDEE